MTLREELRQSYVMGFRDAVMGVSPAPHGGKHTMYDHGHERGVRSLRDAELDGWQVAALVLEANVGDVV